MHLTTVTGPHWQVRICAWVEGDAIAINIINLPGENHATARAALQASENQSLTALDPTTLRQLGNAKSTFLVRLIDNINLA